MQSAPDNGNGGVALEVFRAEERACPYLPDRVARDEFVCNGSVDSTGYERLMELGFRRCGPMYYRPHCDGCTACEPIRVPVSEFNCSRSQRRVWQRNDDVRISVGVPACDKNRHALFERYQSLLHDGCMSGTIQDYEQFFCSSDIDTIEMSYWVGHRLVGLGIVDVCPTALSSVYFYYDPAESRRSIGVFSALAEIELCRRLQLPWWYIGYMVRGCRKMEYKCRFRPYELRGADGVWRKAASDPQD